MPRHGMRFDRRHVQGGDAGFIGAEIEVKTITGSVQRSVIESAGAFKYETVPFAGYPRTAKDMSIACLGSGTWVDGYLCDDLGVGLTSSFDASHHLFQTGTNVSYRAAGFRGPADDYGIIFNATGSLTQLTASDLTSYAITSNPYPHVGFLWVAKQTSSGGSRTFINKYAGGAFGGFSYQIDPTVIEIIPGEFANLNTINLYDQTGAKGIVYAYLPYRQWYIGMFVLDGVSKSGSLTALNLESGRFEFQQFQDLTQFTGTMDGIATGGNTRYFSLGGDAVFSYNPPDMILSAIYMASGTNCAAGIPGNEEPILRNLAKILKARNGYLFSGSVEVERSVASFGNATESRYVTQQLLNLGTASLGRPRGISVIVTGSIPSWTNSHIRNSAFVMTPLSSSDHESQVLNYYASGTEVLESTAVPASTKLYYVKTGSYSGNTLTKKEGTSTGIVLLTGSAVNGSFGLAYRLTGALASLSGSTPGWLLNNEFGMPWIPLSSASLVDFTVEPVVTVRPQTLLSTPPILDGAQRLADAARDASPPQTRADYVADVVTGSLT